MNEEYRIARDEWLHNDCQMTDHFNDYRDCCDWGYAKAQEKIKALESEIERLKEFEFRYKELCK